MHVFLPNAAFGRRRNLNSSVVGRFDMDQSVGFGRRRNLNSSVVGRFDMDQSVGKSKIQ